MTIEVKDGEAYWNGRRMSELTPAEFFVAMIEGLDQLGESIREAHIDAVTRTVPRS